MYVQAHSLSKQLSHKAAKAGAWRERQHVCDLYSDPCRRVQTGMSFACAVFAALYCVLRCDFADSLMRRCVRTQMTKMTLLFGGEARKIRNMPRINIFVCDSVAPVAARCCMCVLILTASHSLVTYDTMTH
mgnify:CR=1 FL=1